MTHFLCTRVRRGFLPCAQQCKDCRDTEDTTGPGPLPPAATREGRHLVCFECGLPRRPGQGWCSCGCNAFVEPAPIGLQPVGEAIEHHPIAVIRGVEARELPGDARTWDAWDTATMTMDLQPDK